VEEKPSFPPNVALLVSIVAVSTASILIRMSDAGPLAIAAYRLIFATIILLPFFLRSGGFKRLIDSSRMDLLTLIGVGFVLAFHFASWISSLNFTSVASSVLFVHIDPIFVAAVSHFILKERINRSTLLGIVIAFAGTSIIALGDVVTGKTNLYGDLLALIGAIMLGIYILSGRRIRQNLDLVSYVTPVYATSALVLTVGCLVTGTRLTPYPPREYLLFFAIAVVPMIFGHTVYNWALKYVSAPVVSISLLGEPVGATILAFLFLNEIPTLPTIIGGVITLAGIYMCARSTSSN
jgi:drug/metabolite transporter (DMT)-like permease